MESEEALVDQYLLNGQFQKAAEQLDELADKYAVNNQMELSKECTQKANILKGMEHPPEEYYKDDHDLNLSMYSFWDMIDDLVGKIKTNFKGKRYSPEIQDEEFLLVTKPHTIEDLTEENARLLQTIHQYQDRLNMLEVAQEENQLLRSSIIQFKQEFAKRKQQNLFQSIRSHRHTKSSFEEEPRIKELESKVKELEDKLKLVTLENEQLKEKDKENIKRVPSPLSMTMESHDDEQYLTPDEHSSPDSMKNSANPGFHL